MKALDQKMRSLGAARRKKVNARASALIAEEVTLQELGQASKLTQARMAKVLGVGQDGEGVWLDTVHAVAEGDAEGICVACKKGSD